MAKLKRCRVHEIAVRVTATGLGERIGEGQQVDFDRVLSPGFTLGDAVAGREDCFEDVAPAAPFAVHADVEDSAS